MVKLMGVASAGRFVGNPLEQSGHKDEHTKSDRLKSKRKARNRKWRGQAPETSRKEPERAW